MKKIHVALAVLIVALLAACGGDDDETNAAPTTATEQSAAGKPERPKPEEPKSKPAGTEIVADDSQYGSILFDAEQQAIYLFDKEASDTAACYGACAEAWPPVLTDGEPTAGQGIDGKLLGTTEREDGTTQVTYGGHPLYYYAHEGPGEVLCHNVAEFGGLWLVLEPSGVAVS